MGYPSQPQGPYEPYGQQQPQPYSGPQPQYGYGQPPPPPQPPRRNLVVILLFAVGLPLLLLGGCAAVFLVLADSGTSRVTTARDSPILVAPSRAPAATAPESEAESTVQQPQQQEQPPAQQEQTAAVGAALTLQGSDPGLTMKVTVDRFFDPATPAEKYMTPKAGNKWVAVQVTLTNVGQAVYDSSPANGALVIDDQGQQYDHTYGRIAEGQDFGGQATINTGDSRKGVILYEVPESARLVKFQYGLNSGFARQKGEWTLS